jgi:hypothetical protein
MEKTEMVKRYEADLKLAMEQGYSEQFKIVKLVEFKEEA